MELREVFVARFERAYEVLSDVNRHNLLDLANCLRMILLEHLADKVNKEFRVPVVFTIDAKHEDVIFAFDVRVDGKSVVNYANHLALNPDRKELKMSSFLGCPIVMFGSEKFTVQEIIKLCANNRGGVHYSDPSDSERTAKLLELEQNVKIGHLEGAWFALATIGKIALEGLGGVYARAKWG